ncbi:MAG TPA: TMEM175 family protein [Gemmatimonadota bacterium]|nr:TMEM175 family protein [Gemmatimonadota bacterium]
MSKGRLEAFTDGVMAILITIMVLELHTPEGVDLDALRPLLPVFLTYVLSFIYLGIYWNNHHHMLQLCDRVDGKVLWANLHLLFWLSLITFATGWMGASHLVPLPTSIYGVVLLMSAIAWTILQRRLVALQGAESRLAAAVRGDVKGWGSVGAYALAIPLAFVEPRVAVGLYVSVALLWLIPDRRFEAQFRDTDS